MKLATTMGIELTYMPAMWDELADTYGEQYEKKNGELSEGYSECVHGRANGADFFSKNLRMILQMRNVPFFHCGTDPDCVEVPTKPYRSLDVLMRRVRVITHHAESLGLVTTLRHFNGGGAHIHTGTKHIEGLNERKLYRQRMMVFAAQNPWLSWAFIGIADNINAEPLTQDTLDLGGEFRAVAEIESDISDHVNEIASKTRALHRESEWRYEWDRNYWLREIENSHKALIELRKKLRDAKRGSTSKRISFSRVEPSSAKDYILRDDTHLKTIEFRNFEMPKNVETLAKYVRLVDAIVRHVSAQTDMDFDLNTIPKNKIALRMMPVEERVAGFKNMLVMLGLDPKEFKKEIRQIEKRARHYRDKAFQNRWRKEIAQQVITPNEDENGDVVEVSARDRERQERYAARQKKIAEEKAALLAKRYQRRADIANGRLPRQTHKRRLLEQAREHVAVQVNREVTDATAEVKRDIENSIMESFESGRVRMYSADSVQQIVEHARRMLANMRYGALGTDDYGLAA